MDKNKKKYLIAAAAFIVFFVMFVFGIKAQRMYAETLTNKQESAQKAAAKTQSKADTTKTKDTEKAKEADKTKENAQKTANSSTAKADESKNKSNVSTNSNSSSNNSSQNSPAAQAVSSAIVKVKPEDPDSQMTLQIIDAVNGNKMVLQKDISSMDGETVGYIMERTLDDAKMKYKATGSASTLYFAAINGLEEKKAGKLSGWCYYVKKNGDTRFHKPNVGSGQWIYHKGDVVVWKYLADGIHDGYEDDWGKSSF